MSAEQFSHNDAQRGADAPAQAGAPPLLHLKNDNCINSNFNRSVFVARGNILGYLRQFGETHVGILTVTLPDCLSAFDFQDKWHSWLTNKLKKMFPTGMWTRERQPRSGNWHAHAVVNVGFDIKTGFPFEQVDQKFYANVDPSIRAIWKQLRETGEKYGFGRIELLPIRHSGNACANYVTKYITKHRNTEKQEGEEKCRLFGAWGGVRTVHSRFSWVSSRIIRKRKAWLAAEFEITDDDGFKRMFGPHWWFHLSRDLMDVIMPVEYYQVPKDGRMDFDDLGFKAYCDDLMKYQNCGEMEAMVTESHFRLFHSIGKRLYGGESKQALNWASDRIGYPPPKPIAPCDPQLVFDLKKSY